MVDRRRSREISAGEGLCMKWHPLLGPGAVVSALLLVAAAAACGGGPGVPKGEREPREITLDETCEFIADEVTVYFKDGAPTADVRAIVSEYGASIRRELDLPGTWVLEG